jgi:hypothetical protein
MKKMIIHLAKTCSAFDAFEIKIHAEVTQKDLKHPTLLIIEYKGKEVLIPWSNIVAMENDK